MSWARESERRVASIFRLHVHLQLCSAPSPHVERGPRRRPPRARHWGLEVVQAQAYATRARWGGCPGPAGRGEASQESLGWLAGGPSTRLGTGGGSVGLQSVLGGVTDPVPRKGPCDAAGVSCGLTGSAGLGQRSLSPLRGRAQRTCQGPETKPNDRQEAE